MPAAMPRLKPVPEPPGELEGLFREHAERIFRTAFRLTGSVADAEDVLQTVFLRLARRKDRLEFSPDPWTYLHREAINAALDLLRSRDRLSLASLDEVAPQLPESPSLGPEARRMDAEIRQAIQQSVARLGSKAAEVFILRYFEGYNNGEIARRLGTTPMVVAVVLHRARAKVRKDMGKFLEENHEAR